MTRGVANTASIASELSRILSLPRRPVLDCEMDRRTRRWAPEAQALIEIMTQKFTRGPRLSCGCRDRRVVALSGGRLLVYHQGKAGPPPLPLEIGTDAFIADNAHDDKVVETVSSMSAGQEALLAGLGRPCITQLNPVQSWILRELPKAGGIFGFLAIGSGKTICSLLAPLAMPHLKSAAILAKPDQRLHYRKHYLHLREHFRVPTIVFDRGDMDGSFRVPGTPVVRFVPYSLLQQQKSTNLLDEISPDLIIADEAHSLAASPSFRRRGSTRTVRFLRYMERRVDVHFLAWSGSLINKSLLDMTHLAAHALGLGSPYPIDPDEVLKWSQVIDPIGMPDHTSDTALALKETFGAKTDIKKAFFVAGLISNAEVREGLRQRAIETLGVVSTRSSSIPTSISIHKREPPPLPRVVKDALSGVRENKKRPDEEVLAEVVKQIECAREVASGFYYKWFYPKAKPEHCVAGGLIDRWFQARQAWNKELRVKLMQAEPFMDSPGLCANAAERAWREPRYEGDLPVWPADSWPAWAKIKDLVEPESRAVWIDDFLAKDAAEWAKEHKGIVWYESRAFGLKVAELAGIPFHAGGKDAEARILAEDGSTSIVASISSHSEGRDGLQFHFSKQLITEVPASAKGWDQLLGRLARQGQEQDCIETWCYVHTTETRDAFRRALALAAFDSEMSPNESLLLAADISFDV